MLKKIWITSVCCLLTFHWFFPMAAAAALPHSPKRGQVENFFFSHIHFILKHRDKLSLTDKQLQRFQELNLQAQKEAILKDAEIQTMAMDLDNELTKDLIYLNHLTHYIDKKYEALKLKEKFFADAFVIIREILDDQQYTDMLRLKTDTNVKIDDNL
jgi:hypothetical protein